MSVLLIEDNPGDAELICLAFARTTKRYDVQCVTRLSDALRLVESQRFTIVLSDLSLPDSTGLSTVATLRERAPQLPLIVLTSLVDQELAEQVLDAGAQDFLEKDRVTPEGLERTIRYAIHRHQVLSENLRLLRNVQSAKALLKQKNRRLTRLYKAAQEFVDHVSHEFRTPLTVIKEYALLIRDGVVGTVNDEQKRMLNVVDDRTDDLNTMVDDMLDVSKLEAGLLGACRANCTLAQIVAHIMPALERKAATRSVTLETCIGPDLPTVFCDREKAGRVIVNLTVNAIKFVSQGGRVKLSAAESSDGRDVVVSVTDNGPGIRPENLDHIFRRFTQIDASRRSGSKGFGLGLSIAKELVDLNFGTIKVDSTPGLGSTFSFTVPLAVPCEVTARYLSQLHRRRGESADVTLLLIRSEDTTSTTDTTNFLNYLLRRNDLLFCADEARWLLILATPEIEVEQFLARAAQAHEDISRNRPYGPLTPVRFEVLGSWSCDDGRDDILARVADHCRQKTEIAEQLSAMT